jgi:hypothetical protein
VPTDLTHAVHSAYGLDATSVPVRYGAQAEREARERGARAFTTGPEIVLGAEARSGGTAERALLAHELVHVVQQRDLGGALPQESSAEGAALEADAVAAEHAVLTGRPLPALRHRPLAGPAPPGTAPRTGTGRVQRAMSYPAAAPAAAQSPGTAPGSAAGQGTGAVSASSPPPGGFASSPPPGGFAPSGPAGAAPASGTPSGQAGTANAGTGSTTTGGWAGFGELVGNSMAEVTLAQWSLADLPGGPAGAAGGQPPGGGPTAPGGTVGPGGPGGAVGAGGPGGRGGPAGIGGRGGPTGPGGQDRDPWRLAADTRSRWSRFGNVVGHDVGDVLSSPWGIDIGPLDPADAGTNSQATGAGAGPGAQPGAAGTGHVGPAVHTDPSRPLSVTGRPQIDTDDLDLDELAGRLYDRLRSRLRMELLLDRERAGLLTDFR